MPNLLIIDDHTIIRTGLKMIIQNFLPHSKIDEAEDGDSAFEKIKQNDYDLLILDVNMPNSDSFGLVSNILALKSNSKILMLSMNSEEIYAKRYLKMGAMGYVQKDAPHDEIKKAITTALNNKRYLSAELSESLLNDLQGNGNSVNPFDDLSPRQFEIVQHLVHGESSADICSKLTLHSSTLGTHKARILGKLKCKNILDLNTLARLHNVISPS
ncbi:MAG TPA: response regulator transcription factor [Chitinophagaceae bacterium]|nr:response regulator transcription factor [Chitinophagaceae bacterium]